jgi:hypothetical protein
VFATITEREKRNMLGKRNSFGKVRIGGGLGEDAKGEKTHVLPTGISPVQLHYRASVGGTSMVASQAFRLQLLSVLFARH